MAICEYCGKPAPLFKKHHPVCEKKFLEDKDTIVRICQWVVRRDQGMDSLPSQLQGAIGFHEQPTGKLRELVIESWEQSAAEFLAAHLLTKGEEAVLGIFRETFELTPEELDRKGLYSRVVRSAILRTLIHGSIPETSEPPGEFESELEQGERIIFHFGNTGRFHTGRVAEVPPIPEGSRVRLGAGSYLKPDSFEGRLISELAIERTDSGEAALTDRGFRFNGVDGAMMIPLSAVAGVIGFGDGIGLVFKEAGRGTDYYIIGDGWFAYNLVVNLLRVAKAG